MTRFAYSLLCLCCAAAALAGLSGCRKASAINPLPDVKVAEKLREGTGGAGTADVKDESAQATGTGWGTLKGKFTYGGDAPEPSFMSTANKDTAVCGQQVPVETLIVDSGTKGVANILVFARKVSRVHRAEGEPEALPPSIFDQKGCIFLTHVLATEVKAPLEIRNSDSVAHNTSFDPAGNTPANPLLQTNATFNYQFSRAMSSPASASCSIHPWMKAYIIARDDPYYAVTAKDGSFEIKDLPAGEEIEFQVWHELSPGGLAAKPAWAKGRFKLKVPADGVEDLQTIEVPAAAFR